MRLVSLVVREGAVAGVSIRLLVIERLQLQHLLVLVDAHYLQLVGAGPIFQLLVLD